MSFRLLSILFKAGHVFGITPWSLHVPKISLLKKFYFLVIFVILEYGFIARELTHLRSNSRQLILLYYIINNVAFIGQNSAFLSRSLMKRKSWISFLRNLKTTAKLTCVRTRTKSKKSFFFVFVFVSILHLITPILSLQTLTQLRSNVWREFYTEFFHTIFNFHNQFLSCVLVNMIRTRYKNLRKMVRVQFERRRKIRLDVLKKIQYTVRSLKLTVDDYNDLFGLTNLFSVSITLASILNVTKFALPHLGLSQLLSMNLLNLMCIIWLLVSVVSSKMCSM